MVLYLGVVLEANFLNYNTKRAYQTEVKIASNISPYPYTTKCFNCFFNISWITIVV